LTLLTHDRTLIKPHFLFLTMRCVVEMPPFLTRLIIFHLSTDLCRNNDLFGHKNSILAFCRVFGFRIFDFVEINIVCLNSLKFVLCAQIKMSSSTFELKGV
jgi:hypothetical protein